MEIVDWKKARIKWSVDQVKNGVWGEDPEGDLDNPETIVCVRVADFNRRTGFVDTEKLTYRLISDKDQNGRLLEKHDLLIEKSGGGDKQLVGYVAYYDLEYKAVTSNFVARMSCAKDQYPRFWFYYHQFIYEGRLNYPSIKQTTGIQNLDIYSYLNQRASYPPLPTQKAIAHYLDARTARIDALITAKEKLLRLLAERRSALITRAVTRGLDENVELKDSEVDWLGDIPVGWEVKRLRFLTSVVGGGTPTTSNSEYWKGDIPWVSPKDMKVATITSTKDYITEEGLNNSPCVLINTDVLIMVVRSGILRHSIPVALTGTKVALNQDMKAFINNNLVKSDYLYYFFHGLQKKLLPVLAKPGSTVESIEMQYLMDLPIPLPPAGTQENIVADLNNQLTRFKQSASKIHHSLHLLREYRAALITAAVSGEVEIPVA